MSTFIHAYNGITGWYDVPEGMVFNFPAKIAPDGQYTVIEGLELSETTKAKIAECVDVSRRGWLWVVILFFIVVHLH